MKLHILVLALSLLMMRGLSAQNVGQNGHDTIRNYVDINGNRQGLWEKKYKEGTLAYKAFFKDNKLIGDYYRYYPNGEVSVIIKYDKNNPDKLAPTTYYWDDGKIMAKGFFINQNKKDSVWEYYNVLGELKIKTHYSNGKKNGEEYIYYRNGNVTQVAMYKNDILNGFTTRYFDNGAKQIEMKYKNGKLNGAYNVYYANGKPRIKGFFINNLKESTWIYYTVNGAFDKKIVYHGGIAENQNELDSLFTKQMEIWEKNKGKYKEPTLDDFLPGGNKKNQNNINEEY